MDHNRVLLGRGAEVFARAKQAIRAWKMFEMDWLELCWTNAAIEVGSTVGVLVGHYGFWSLNPCRIAYVLEERGRVEKFRFAYGTLPGHAEIGEERFSVEFDPRDSSVWYDLYAPVSSKVGSQQCSSVSRIRATPYGLAASNAHQQRLGRSLTLRGLPGNCKPR